LFSGVQGACIADILFKEKERQEDHMDAYGIGVIVGVIAFVALIAWLIIGSIVKTVRFNVIRKQQGEEAAREFWNSKKKRVKK
jgi:uncharacterized membrane protein